MTQQTTVLLAISSIFILGLRHGIDYDHIAAITDITGTQRSARRGMFLGFMYAAGHGLVILLLGAAAVMFGVHLPQGIDAWMERIVGLTLITLGVYVAYILIKRNMDGEPLRIKTRYTLLRSGYFWLKEKIFRSFGREAKPHAHAHMESYGNKSAFMVGVIHGIGAETPTQLLFFIVEAGIGGAMAGLLGVIAFVTGLIISNTVMCAISVGLFGTSSAREPIYKIVAGVTAVYSVCVGIIFLFGASSILPPI